MKKDRDKEKEEKRFRNVKIFALVFVFSILSIAEAFVVKNPKFAFFTHIFFLVFLITVSSFIYQKAMKLRIDSLTLAWEMEKLSNFFRALILLPLLRIVSFSMPLASFSKVDARFLISVPIAISIYIIQKNFGMGRKSLGLTLLTEKWSFSLIIATQILIALTGIPLGFLQFLILKPSSLISSLTLENLLIPGFIFIFSVGFLEELIFRGIIQKKSEELFGRISGLIFASLLFMLTHLSYLPHYLLFTFGIGMFYGYVFQKTKNLYGIGISHGIMSIITFLIAPFLLQ